MRVEDWAEEMGPLDIILLYHNITDLQIRRHLGNPDIHVSKESWGYFAVDPERFIQSVYLTHCASPHRLDRQLRRFLVWLDDTDQAEMLIKRVEARGHLLKARPPSRERIS
jgi:hypothetical protein